MQQIENVTVLGDRHFRIYAVGKGPAVLLEGGVSAVVPAVLKQAAAGLVPPGVSHLVVMHAHYDHVCGIPGLREIFPGATVAGSAEARKILQRAKIVTHFFKEDAATTEALRQETGLVEKDSCSVVDHINVERVIEDGEKWTLGPGSTLHFYRAPGHSPCSLLAYLPESEVLFSSDCAGFPVNDKCIFPIFFEGYAKYLTTIDRMRDFRAEILAGAHEQLIFGRKYVAEFLDLARSETERMKEFVSSGRKKGLGEQEIADLLFDMYYCDNLRIYSVNNIRFCCSLLVRRVLETEENG